MESSHALSDTEKRQRQADSAEVQLDFDVARSLSEILGAWRLLYETYLRVGFIQAGSPQLHLVPQAIGPQTLVVLGHIRGDIVSTISAIGDNPLGLPLDTVFPEELSKIRDKGGKLVEIGLFADRRDVLGQTGRTFHALFELMRYTFYYGRYMGATDYLCGIPPKRARLYQRTFGFFPVGEVKSYATVEGNPVQLMHGEISYGLANFKKHRALEFFMANPLPETLFQERFMFSEEELADSPLAELNAKRNPSD